MVQTLRFLPESTRENGWPTPWCWTCHLSPTLTGHIGNCERGEPRFAEERGRLCHRAGRGSSRWKGDSDLDTMTLWLRAKSCKACDFCSKVLAVVINSHISHISHQCPLAIDEGLFVWPRLQQSCARKCCSSSPGSWDESMGNSILFFPCRTGKMTHIDWNWRRWNRTSTAKTWRASLACARLYSRVLAKQRKAMKSSTKVYADISSWHDPARAMWRDVMDAFLQAWVWA